MGALYAAFPLEQCVVLIADWQCLLRTIREPFHEAACERKLDAHEVGRALAGWDGLLIVRDDTHEDSLLTAILQSPLAARIGLVSWSACPSVRWTQELWRVTAVACNLPCPRHRHADALIRSLPMLPADWRPAVLGALRSPGEWTVKRVCYEARTRRRTLERWCQKLELPSPAALFGGDDVTHFRRTSRVDSR